MANLENLTIMFTDIVGFSDLSSKLSREESQAYLDKHDRILSKVIKRFAGKIIKTIGDSFLVSFRSPTDAVICGMAMQDALWEANQATDTQYPIIIRVALNAGEVRETQNDVFGDAVNIAARLESITPANYIYLTEAVYLAMSKSEVCVEAVDAFEFKGVSDKVKVYQVSHASELEPDSEPETTAKQPQYPYGGAHIHRKANHRPLTRVTKVTILASVLILVVASTWWLTRYYSSNTAPEKIAVEFATEPLIDSASHEQEEQAKKEQKTALEQQAELLITKANYVELENLIEQAYTEQPELESAYMHLVAGHTHMYFQRYQEALESYESAFDIDRKLSSDSLAAENMMILLERKRRDASRLIAKNLNSLLITKLGERSGEAELTGRYDAFNLLKDSGHEEAIDRVGLNIWDLRELKKCSLKKVAVVELKRLKDPRALDALNEVIKVGLVGRMKYSCLRKDAKEAVTLIENLAAN